MMSDSSWERGFELAVRVMAITSIVCKIAVLAIFIYVAWGWLH